MQKIVNCTLDDLKIILKNKIVPDIVPAYSNF